MHFQLHHSKRIFLKQKHYFTLVSDSNAQVVATSELYHNRNDMIDTITSIKQGTLLAPIYDVDNTRLSFTHPR